jgi:hypothetical protein
MNHRGHRENAEDTEEEKEVKLIDYNADIFYSYDKKVVP